MTYPSTPEAPIPTPLTAPQNPYPGTQTVDVHADAARLLQDALYQVKKVVVGQDRLDDGAGVLVGLEGDEYIGHGVGVPGGGADGPKQPVQLSCNGR